MKWKYTIDIKSEFTEISDEIIVAKLSQKLVDQLILIKSEINTSNMSEGIIEYVDMMLEELIDSFLFLIHICDGTIDEDNFDDYGYDGDYEEVFNNCMSDLYDLGDTHVHIKTREPEKLIWIG